MALLGELQRVFENTYDREAGVELESCVVGPRRCAELAARSATASTEMSHWARFFYYVENGSRLRVALFYAEAMIETLEAADPRRALSESNVVPFVVFAEEASHALHTSFAFDEGGPDRVRATGFLVELELLARIDAYLLLCHFVHGLTSRLTEGDRAWARREAVTRWDVPYADPSLEARYRTAARHAGAFLDSLEALDPPDRLVELRRFRGLTLSEKTRIADLGP